MRKATTLFALLVLLLSGAAFAADLSSPDLLLEEERGVERPQPLEVKTEAEFHTGYRIIDIDGSHEAAEYEYLKDSVLFGGELRLTRLPHRLHLDYDFRNKKDFFGDAWYAYKDIFFVREINSTFFHNLPNIDLDPFRTGARVDVRDQGETYGLTTSLDRFYIRGKTPNFPLHVYVDGHLVRKSGDRQQKSLLGEAWFTNIVRSSGRRKVDFETRNIKVGINSHVGPIEIDYAHGEKRFEVGNDRVLHDAYSQPGFPPGMRAAGVYPHNITPEVKSSVDTLKLHTSHVGKIVATGTFQRTANRNRNSGAESEYFIGAGGVTLMPAPNLTFFLKYRHKKAEFDNPDTVSISDLTNAANTYTYIVRPSISSTSNKTSVTVRYRPLRRLTLNAGYHFLDIDRRHAEEWGLPKNSQEHTAQISARIRFASYIQAKAEYIHREIKDPAYNTAPDSSNEGRLSLSWLPTPRVSALLSFDIVKESRDDLHFADTEEPDNRDVRKESATGSITYQILDDLSLAASYAYLNYRIEQDIEFQDGQGTPHTDRDVPYRSKAQSFALDAHYAPHKLISFSAGVNHTKGQSSFSPSDAALLAPKSISSFSKMRTEETEYKASCELKLGKGYSSKIQYQYANFDDELENPFDDAKDGEVHIFLVTFSKRW